MIDQEKIINFRKEFFALVNEAKNIVITSHMGPDDDSIASVLSIYFILNEKYPEKNIRIIYSSNKDARWSYFENFEKVEFVNEIVDELEDADLLIGLDGDMYSRFSKEADKMAAKNCRKIAIDHHKNPPDEFDLLLVEPEISSNAEIIYTLFYEEKNSIPPRVAEILLMGILGDTGNLRYINKNQISAFPIVSRLVAEGDIDIAYLESRYSTYPEKVFNVMQELMKNTSFKEVTGWPKFLCAYLPYEYIVEYDIDDVDISAARNIFIANYGTKITGAEWSMVATSHRDGEVKVSMRSLKGSINVRLLGQNMGIGGGHDRAGGARFPLEDGKRVEVADALNRIINWMKEHPATY